MRAEERSRAGLEANLHRVERVADEHAHGARDRAVEDGLGHAVLRVVEEGLLRHAITRRVALTFRDFGDF